MAYRAVQKYCFIMLITILLIGTPIAVPVLAQGEVNFSPTMVENNFPDELIFRVAISSSGAEIVSAKFAYTNEGFYGSRSYTKDPIEFTPGTSVSLEYILDTRDITTPPLMAYLYHWEVEDADGNKYQSEEVLIRYEDNRYDWQVLENQDIAVWWHDRPESFGQEIFEISAASVAAQQELFQAELDFQMLIVISNSEEEFNSWHSIAHDWIGGQTFNDYAITNQIVESGNQSGWLASVIPHEISHIFFNHVVYNPVVSVPVWLNEGVAQYNEFVSHEWEISKVESAAASGGLVPLRSLEDGFGSYDVDRVYLSYAEAYSAAAYLVERFGNQGLSTLLAAYKDGMPSVEAFPFALGVSLDQFELDWADSVGAVNYQIPTPMVLPTFFPSPTVGIPSSGGTPEPDRSPTEIGSPSTDQPEYQPVLLLMLIAIIAGVVISVGLIIFIIHLRRKS